MLTPNAPDLPRLRPKLTVRQRLQNIPVRRIARLFSTLLPLVGVFVPMLAHAYSGPGGGPLVGFGNTVLDFLTGPLAYVVFGIGIAIAALGMIMGSRDAVQRGVLALVGGGLLFGVHAVIDFVQQAAR